MDNIDFKPALNLTEQIADHLAQLIIMGVLPGGERVQELKFAQELDVSRGSVREALLILERRHLIEVVPRRGAIVHTVDREDALALIDLLAAAERHWLSRFVKTPHPGGRARVAGPTGSVFVRLSDAVSAMEKGAKGLSAADSVQGSDTALTGLLSARDGFYFYLLAGANKYSRAVFECLLPTSQLILRKLIMAAVLDPHDLARYYRALCEALETKDMGRVHELLNAFYKRLFHLSDKSLSSAEGLHLAANHHRCSA